MKHDNHNSFIKTPITKILEEMISASDGVSDGIENYALWDYILQSTFLKMTGAQEQKFKCICWELASNDYEFRREFLTSKEKLGAKGMSSYEDKNNVYCELVKQIKKYDFRFDLETFFAEKIDEKRKTERKEKMRKDIRYYMKKVFENTNFAIWGKKYYDSVYPFFETSVTKKHFARKEQLFEKFNKQKDGDVSECLQERYRQLYNHRNRLAHNTLSYQQNLPTLDTLRKEEYKYENYFVYFSILILIDEIMVKLYEKYLEVIE